MTVTVDRCAIAGVNTDIKRTTEANITFIEIFLSKSRKAVCKNINKN